MSGIGGAMVSRKTKMVPLLFLIGCSTLPVVKEVPRAKEAAATALVIKNVAGDSEEGFSGDGEHATEARLRSPRGITVDARGNLYIADSGNNVVRKVDALTGIITTIAGTGERGFCGDEGPAIGACLSFPRSLAFDGDGNLYIADTGNARIRRVDAVTGIITTVAGTGIKGFGGDGGPALKAVLSVPSSVAVDPGGNIYIADSQNSRIRKVERGKGTMTTVNGHPVFGNNGSETRLQGSRVLGNPVGIAIDKKGHMYIADSALNQVKKVEIATERTTVVAGNGANDFGGDGGPAPQASLASPSAVALDQEGNLYIADSGNNRIRRVDAVTGIITTVAGPSVSDSFGGRGPAIAVALEFPAGIAIDHRGQIFVVEPTNNRVRKIAGVH